MFPTHLIIYVVIFVAVLALVQGAYLMFFGKSIQLDNKVNRRLALLEKGGQREQVLEQLRKEMTQHMNGFLGADRRHRGEATCACVCLGRYGCGRCLHVDRAHRQQADVDDRRTTARSG